MALFHPSRWHLVLLGAVLGTALVPLESAWAQAPGRDASGSALRMEPARPAQPHAVDVNTATEADLDALLGFGPAHTARLLAARQQQAFSDWADLMRRTPGVGVRTARRLSAAGLRVHGQPYGEPPPAPGQTAPQ